MTSKTVLNHNDVMELATMLAEAIIAMREGPLPTFKVYAIPRGGVPAMYALMATNLLPLKIVHIPEEADIFIDDIIDSGATMGRYCDRYPGKPFYALIDKTDPVFRDAYEGFIEFPWEGESTGGIEDNIRRLIQYVGEDASREGLLETPARVAKAWKHWTSGYNKNPAEILKVFADGAEGCDQMVVRKDIPIYSHCEHHLAAIIGKCTIAYIPDGKVLGLSKLDRLADMFARRLQVQERLTNQIADALVEHINPQGVGVWISARHLCVESRGVQHSNSETITTALRGCIRNQDAARAEFLALARS